MTDSLKAPSSFWVISILALLWNAMGCFQWFVEYGYYTNPASREALPEAMRGMYDSQASWIYIVFAVAVLGGLIASIGLLLKKAWSDQVFFISLVAVIILHGYSMVATNYIEELGISSVIMPIIVTLIAAYLLYFAKKNKASEILT